MDTHDIRLLSRKYDDVLEREHALIEKYGLTVALENSRFKALLTEEHRIRDEIDQLVESVEAKP